ncbi:MAG: hypothetical protein NVSMB31_09770 [Vulcanimicrobiaceae bacterium]
MSTTYAGTVHEQESRDAQLQVVDTLAPSLSLRDAIKLSEKLTFKQLSGFKILVVEDEPTIAQTLRYNLEHVGYVVCEAGDGRTAIDVAFKEKPHLILMDVMLPVLNGFQTCAVIRGQMDVPIIMVTAKDSEDDKIVGFEVGATDYITKPFDLAGLLNRIRTWLV